MADAKTVIEGKNVALTGKFSKMKRKEVSAALEELGASVGSLTGKTDLLIYGEKAGSKLQKAERMGVTAHNEDWLVALLAGEDPGAAGDGGLEGPLADYMERVEALVETLRDDPRTRVSFYRNPGVSSATLERAAKKWKVDAFSPAIQNLYRQANGFFLTWVAVTHPEAKTFGNFRMPESTRMPSSYEIEQVPWNFGGKFFVLPIEDALMSGESYIDFSFEMPMEETREAYGRTWAGNELERAIRLLEYGHDYYPVVLLALPGEPAPRVLVGQDHGGPWEDAVEYTFEGFFEAMLSKYGTVGARTGDTEEFDFAGFAPGPPKAESETFEVTIERVESIDVTEMRARQIAQHHTWYFKDIAKALGIGERSSRDRLEVCRDIAKVSADFEQWPRERVHEVAKGLGVKKKKEMEAKLSEKLFVDAGQATELVTVQITGLFDASNQDKYRAETDIAAVAKALYGTPDRQPGVEILARSGRKNRKARVSVVVLDGEVGKEGDVTRLDLCPAGFSEVDGAYVWEA